MKSAWNEVDANAVIKKYQDLGIAYDLAIRTYSARLLGKNPELVLHGGGNTSVKSQTVDLLGKELDVLYVKGSGWDLGEIEPAGHPAVKLAPMLALRALENLSDEEMVNQQRINLLDSKSPNPSVETLLHAFLPQKFIDHTHANAILSLVNLADSEKRIRDIYGEEIALVPYIMPGFKLAKTAAEIWESNKPPKGLILLHHGIFSFGDTARESYETMIELVNRAEKALSKHSVSPGFKPSHGTDFLSSWIEKLPVLRGALNQPQFPDDNPGFVTHYRTSKIILDFVNQQNLEKMASKGPPTPDHVIRTKRVPLILPFHIPANQITGAVKDYRTACHEEFLNNQSMQNTQKKELDTAPRVILIPNLGMISVGANLKSAKAVADIYEQTCSIILQAENMGGYQPLDPVNLFDMEYWDLEQAKLKKGAPLPLAAKVAVITGAAGGIGRATAELFSRNGAHLVLLDINQEKLETTREGLANPENALAIPVDVTNSDQVKSSIQKAVTQFGGIDILISNAGTAFMSPMEECDQNLLQKSLDLNLLSHQKITSMCFEIMKNQKTGGAVVFNASKSAFAPGPGFGPYSIAKAALIALMRQYAIEGGKHGITSNAVNADRVQTGLFADGVLESRAKARNLTVSQYLRGNLLGREVGAGDVAQAFLYLVMAQKTTASVIPVDGGNMAAAPR